MVSDEFLEILRKIEKRGYGADQNGSAILTASVLVFVKEAFSDEDVKNLKILPIEYLMDRYVFPELDAMKRKSDEYKDTVERDKVIGLA